jgi:hypothetical protein
MAKINKAKRSRFEGISLDTLNKEAAKVTNKEIEVKEVETSEPKDLVVEDLPTEVVNINTEKRGKGRPKISQRQPLNTAIEPKNKQRLEFLAMLNGGSVADQLNIILNKYFTDIERVDELIEIFEEKKRKR